MDNWKNKSMSFGITTESNEKVLDFFKRFEKEHVTFEKAIAERIEHLFNNHVDVSGAEKDAAYQQLLKLFSIGYKLGWNDYKSIIDEKKE